MDSVQAKGFMAQLEGLTLGGWSIIGSYGFGKSAVVMKGEKSGIIGAVKVFHPELVERYGKKAQLERIDREKSLIGEKHEDLVEIYDGGECEDTGHLYVVMESIPYPNLLEALPDIPFESVRFIISRLASAAIFLEAKGLAHRDIKPENIAISPDFKTVKLLDLGVLRPFGISNLTDVNAKPFIGTLRYSSPEFLIRSEETTLEGLRAVTFYQLGAVLHDLIMKKELFSEDSDPYAALVEAVLNKTPVVHCPDSDLVTLCNYCLAKKPETRLELVSWKSFFESGSNGEAIDSARDKILKRQKYLRSQSSGSGLMRNELTRQLKSKLESICNRYQTRIGIVINDLKMFPLFRVESSVDYKASSFRILIQFEKNDDLGFASHLHLAFEVSLIDENNGTSIYRASHCSFLSDTTYCETIPECNDIYFCGNDSDLLSSQITEQLFIVSAELSYEVFDSDSLPEDSQLLVLETGGKHE